MNKISFTIPNAITNKIETNKPLELTNQLNQLNQITNINVNPKIIKNKNITNYINLAPNVYKFC